MSAFSETRDKWAPVKTFTISLLFALRNGSNKQGKQPVFVSCEHLKVTVMAGTKWGETLFGKRIKGSPLPAPLGQRRHYTGTERLLAGITPSRNESCSSQKPSLPDPCWLSGVCRPGGGPRGGQVWKKKPGNWPERRQRA